MKPGRSTKRNQKGYLLLSVMLLIAIMLIMMAIEAPRLAQQIKRDKEEELVHRGREYAIAIRKYYHKFGQYPTSLEQLEDTNHMRFLRKRYIDPMTGKDDWKLVHLGEAEIKIPTPAGQLGSGLQSTNPGLSGSTTSGTQGGPAAAASPTPSGVAGLNPNPASTGLGGTQLGGQTGAPGQVGSLQTSNIGNGQTFGGGGIIGVASVSKATGIKEFNDKSEYDEWLFVYEPKIEQATAAFGGAAGAGIVVAAPRANSGSGNPNPSGSPSPSPTPAVR